MNDNKRYIVRRFYNNKWSTLGTVYADTEDNAWNKARELYGNPITQVIDYYNYLRDH